MATHNGAKYLQDQLKSFTAQTRLPDEVIITDDNSDDETCEIIAEFATSAPFQVHWEQNKQKLGYTANFNQALMRTTGDLVFLSDQDDVWFPEKLKLIESYALVDPGALVFMNDAALTDANLNDTGLTKLGQISSAGLSNSSFVMGCCAAVRRELLEICLPIPVDFNGHDNWIVRMAEGVGRKRVYKDVLQCYRRHGDNASNFITNRTRKVGLYIFYLDVLTRKLADTQRQKDRLALALKQGRIFLTGLQNASCRADPLLSKELCSFAARVEHECIVLNERYSLSLRPRWMRFLPVFRLWRAGDYRNFHGYKGAVQDILLS